MAQRMAALAAQGRLGRWLGMPVCIEIVMEFCVRVLPTTLLCDTDLMQYV